jgi:hypothetical protein
MDNLKKCSRCGEEKTFDQFYKLASGKYGLQAHCKSCDRDRDRKYRDENREKWRESMRIRNAKWREENPEKCTAIIRRFAERHPGYAKEQAARLRALDPEKARERDRAWYARNAEKVRARKNAYNKINPKARATRMNYRLTNLERCREMVREWSKANPDKRCIYANRRRSAKLNATPLWANQFIIDEIYELAQLRTTLTGIKWHVDHIVPLQSKLVCGLHTEANLQVIPAIKNAIKGNSFWPDMP